MDPTSSVPVAARSLSRSEYSLAQWMLEHGDPPAACPEMLRDWSELSSAPPWPTGDAELSMISQHPASLRARRT